VLTADMIVLLMPARAKSSMTADEYLTWAEGREGRWELFNGRPIAIDNSKGIGFWGVGCYCSKYVERLREVDDSG
jgi:hypothetical protein